MSYKPKNIKSIRKKYVGAVLGSFLGGTLWWTLGVYQNSSNGAMWGTTAALFAWLGFRLAPSREGEESPQLTVDVTYTLFVIAFSGMLFALFGGKTFQMIEAVKKGQMNSTYLGIARYWIKLFCMKAYIVKLGKQLLCGLGALALGSLPMLLDTIRQERVRTENRKQRGEMRFENDERWLCRPYFTVARLVMGFEVFFIFFMYYFYVYEKEYFAGDLRILFVFCTVTIGINILVIFFMMILGKCHMIVDANGVEVHDLLRRKHEMISWENVPYLYTDRRQYGLAYILTDREYTQDGIELMMLGKIHKTEKTIVFTWPYVVRSDDGLDYLLYHYGRKPFIVG